MVKPMLIKSLFRAFCAFLWPKFLLLVFFSSCLVAQAELQWEQKTISIQVHPVQVEERVTFHFTNAGTNAVDILSLKSTCGCLTPSMSTNRFEAGEAGTVDVVFNLRDKIGPQRKGVAVRSSDNPKQPVILYVETNIREAYTLSSKRLEWSLSGDRTLQTCRLLNQLAEPVHLVSATSSSESFNIDLKPVREGFEYEVQVSPKESAMPSLTVITVQTECPPELTESRAYTFTAVLR